jgi:hypothetical protein
VRDGGAVTRHGGGVAAAVAGSRGTSGGALDHRRTAVALAVDELRHEAIVIDLSGADAVRLLPRDH